MSNIESVLLEATKQKSSIETMHVMRMLEIWSEITRIIWAINGRKKSIWYMLDDFC